MIIVTIVLFYVLLHSNVSTCSKRANPLVDRKNPSTTIDTASIPNNVESKIGSISDKVKSEIIYDGEKADYFL